MDLRAQPDAGLEEGMSRGKEKERERAVQGRGADGKESLHSLEIRKKVTESRHKFLRVEDKAFFNTVKGAFGNSKVCTEFRNRGEPSGKPGIKEGNKETERKGRIRDDNGKEQGMGRTAGGAQGTAEAYHAVGDMAVVITDKMTSVGSVPAEGGSRGMAGRALGDHGKAVLFQKGADGMLIEVF